MPDRGQGNDDWNFQSAASIGHGYLVVVGYAARTGAPGSALYGVWNGREWSISTGPRTDVDLNAVSFDGRHVIWAAGAVGTSMQTFGPVVQLSKVNG